MLGEVALQRGAAPGAEHPLGTPGAAVTAMALQSHQHYLSCWASGLAVSWHPHHPHCPDWVSCKQGHSHHVRSSVTAMQGTQPKAGQGASSGLACCLVLRLIALIKTN